MRPCLALLVAAVPRSMIAPAVALHMRVQNGSGAPGGTPNATRGRAGTNSTRLHGHLEQQLLNSSHHTVEIAGWTYNASYGFCVDNCNRDIGPRDGEVGPLHMNFPLCVEACSVKEYCTGVEWWPQNLCYLFQTRSLLRGCGGKGAMITSIACMVKATRGRPSFFPADCSAEAAPPPATDAATTWGPGMFVADAGNFRIMMYSPSTATTPIPRVVAGGSGRGGGLHQFDYPHMVLVDSRNNLIVSDTYNHRVVKWAPHASTGELAAGGNGKGSSLNQLYNPKGMALDAAGYLFIADSLNHRVVRWVVGAPEGRVMAGGNGLGATNKHIKPYSVAIDSHNAMIIVDVHMHRVLRWKPHHRAGHVLVGFHGRGVAVNQVNTAIGVTVDSRDNIVVADYFNHRVLKFPPDSDRGIVVAGGHGQGEATHQLSYPSSVTVDANGHYIVADTDNNRVMDWPPFPNASGTVVAGGLGEGSSPRHLAFPKSVATTP